MVVRLLFPFRIRVWFCDGRKKEGSREKPSKKTNSKLDPANSDAKPKPITTWSPAFPRAFNGCLFHILVLVGYRAGHFSRKFPTNIEANFLSVPTKRKGSTQLELLKFIFIHFIKGKRKLTPFLPACKEEWVLLLRHHGRTLYSPSFSAFVGSTCHVNSTKIKSSHEIMLEVTTLAAQWFLNHH